MPAPEKKNGRMTVNNPDSENKRDSKQKGNNKPITSAVAASTSPRNKVADNGKVQVLTAAPINQTQKPSSILNGSTKQGEASRPTGVDHDDDVGNIPSSIVYRFCKKGCGEPGVAKLGYRCQSCYEEGKAREALRKAQGNDSAPSNDLKHLPWQAPLDLEATENGERADSSNSYQNPLRSMSKVGGVGPQGSALRDRDLESSLRRLAGGASFDCPETSVMSEFYSQPREKNNKMIVNELKVFRERMCRASCELIRRQKLAAYGAIMTQDQRERLAVLMALNERRRLETKVKSLEKNIALRRKEALLNMARKKKAEAVFFQEEEDEEVEGSVEREGAIRAATTAGTSTRNEGEALLRAMASKPTPGATTSVVLSDTPLPETGSDGALHRRGAKVVPFLPRGGKREDQAATKIQSRIRRFLARSKYFTESLTEYTLAFDKESGMSWYKHKATGAVLICTPSNCWHHRDDLCGKNAGGGSEIDKIFLRADVDRDGRLNVKEFTRFILALLAARNPGKPWEWVAQESKQLTEQIIRCEGPFKVLRSTSTIREQKAVTLGALKQLYIDGLLGTLKDEFRDVRLLRKRGFFSNKEARLRWKKSQYALMFTFLMTKLQHRPWVAPDIGKAVAYGAEKKVSVKKTLEAADRTLLTYFALLRAFCIYFYVLSVLVVPSLYIFSRGSYYSANPRKSVFDILSALSVGNLFPYLRNNNEMPSSVTADEVEKVERRISILNSSLPEEDVLMIVSRLDLVFCAAALIGTLIVKCHMGAFLRHFRYFDVSTQDYSVLLRGIPAGYPAEELAVALSNQFCPPQDKMADAEIEARFYRNHKKDQAAGADRLEKSCPRADGDGSGQNLAAGAYPSGDINPASATIGKERTVQTITEETPLRPGGAGSLPSEANSDVRDRVATAVDKAIEQIRCSPEYDLLFDAHRPAFELNKRILNQLQTDTEHPHLSVQDQAHCFSTSLQSKLKGGWVADVAYLPRNMDVILQRLEGLMRVRKEYAELRSVVKMMSWDDSYSKEPAKKQQRNQLNAKLERKTRELVRFTRQTEVEVNAMHFSTIRKKESPMAAIVTFNNQQAAKECLALRRICLPSVMEKKMPCEGADPTPSSVPAQHYSSSTAILSSQAPSSSTDGSHRGKIRARAVWVFKAPHPADINWHNMGSGVVSLLLRRLVGLVVLLLLFMLTFPSILSYCSRKVALTEFLNRLSYCESEIPAAYFGTYDYSSLGLSAPIMLRHRAENDSLCGAFASAGGFLSFDGAWERSCRATAVKTSCRSFCANAEGGKAHQYIGDGGQSCCSCFTPVLKRSNGSEEQAEVVIEGGECLSANRCQPFQRLTEEEQLTGASLADQEQEMNNTLSSSSPLASLSPYAASSCYLCSQSVTSPAQPKIPIAKPSSLCGNLYCPSFTSTSKVCSSLACLVPAWSEPQYGSHPCFTYSASDLLSCYCDKLYLSQSYQRAGLALSYIHKTNDFKTCSPYYFSMLGYDMQPFLLGIAVGFCNVLSGLFLSLAVVPQLKYLFREEEYKVAMVLTGGFSYITSCCSLLIGIFASLGVDEVDDGRGRVLETEGGTGKSYSWCQERQQKNYWTIFSPEWYRAVVPTSFWIVLFTGLFAPLSDFLALVLKRWHVRMIMRKARTQVTLNRAAVGLDLHLERRCGTILFLVFSSFTLCGLMPILIPLSAVLLSLLYLSERRLLMKGFRKHQYGPRFRFLSSLSSLPLYALFPHAIVSLIGFSAPCLPAYFFGLSTPYKSGQTGIALEQALFSIVDGLQGRAATTASASSTVSSSYLAAFLKFPNVAVGRSNAILPFLCLTIFLCALGLLISTSLLKTLTWGRWRLRLVSLWTTVARKVGFEQPQDLPPFSWQYWRAVDESTRRPNKRKRTSSKSSRTKLRSILWTIVKKLVFLLFLLLVKAVALLVSLIQRHGRPGINKIEHTFTLSTEELKDGWRLVNDRLDGLRFIYKMWLTDDLSRGARRKKRTPKLTWEVIEDVNGIFSYHLGGNADYKHLSSEYHAMTKAPIAVLKKRGEKGHK